MDTRIALIGIGGYGDVYVRALMDEKKRAGYRIEGVIDPYAKSARGYGQLKSAGVAFFDSVDEFYKERGAELAVIATPIPLHEEQAVCAMEHGSNVLLEKPIAATPEAARRIEDSAKRTGVKFAVGFQWCYDEAMLALKADFDSGILGAPLDVRSLVIWPRDFAYYSRGTGWAGKKFDGKGRPIFDSVASNATAHYLENILWLTGKGYEGAGISEMRAETWRANDIETYDTVTLLAKLDNGASLTYVVSHATPPETQQDPMFEYRFENAVARFGGFGEKGAALTAEFNDGTVKDYGVSYNGTNVKIWTMLDAIRENAPIPCPASAALRHADAIAMMREIQPEAYVFDGIKTDGVRAWVPGLAEKLIKCYKERLLLTEAGVKARQI